MCVCLQLCVCALVIITVRLSPVDVHAPDITGWRLLSVSNIKLNAPQRKKLCVASIQEGEICDVSILSDD